MCECWRKWAGDREKELGQKWRGGHWKDKKVQIYPNLISRIGIKIKNSLFTIQKIELFLVIDAKSVGKNIDFDEKTVQEVESHVPGAEFSPDDISIFELKPKDDVHGIGYHPLQNTGVLSQKYGTMSATLKTTQRGKGIRGQAFGVGAFEDEDEDIYTNYDLNQYDFEVGASTSMAQKDVAKCAVYFNIIN